MYIRRTCVAAAEFLKSERNMNTKKMLNENWKILLTKKYIYLYNERLKCIYWNKKCEINNYN